MRYTSWAHILLYSPYFFRNSLVHVHHAFSHCLLIEYGSCNGTGTLEDFGANVASDSAMWGVSNTSYSCDKVYNFCYSDLGDSDFSGNVLVDGAFAGDILARYGP